MQIESRANYRAPGSIALRVAEKLAQRTPLNGVLVRFWYEEGNRERIGISTLVSYVLKPLVDHRNSRLYSMWKQLNCIEKEYEQLNQNEIGEFCKLLLFANSYFLIIFKKEYRFIK